MSAETLVRLRRRDGLWEVRGESTPLPTGVNWLWGPMPPWEPWPTLLAVASEVEGFEAKVSKWTGMRLRLLRAPEAP